MPYACAKGGLAVNPPADLSAAGECTPRITQQLIGHLADRMPTGSTQKQRAGEIKSALGILNPTLVFGMVIEHIYHPQEKQPSVKQ